MPSVQSKLLSTGNNTFVDECLPAKAGSTVWKSLLLYHTTGVKYPNLHLFNTHIQRAEQRFKDALNAQSRTLAFIIARNPYERLLSAYLDKVKTGLVEKWVGLPKNASFSQTVELVARRQKYETSFGHTPSFTLFNQHFLPISTVYVWCLPPHNPKRFVLWLEAQPLWYAKVVNAANIQLSALQYSPPQKTNGGANSNRCFYRPPMRTCETSLRPYTRQETVAWLSRRDNASETRTALLRTYYANRKLVRQVTEIYSGDFNAFGYQKWDGPAHGSIPVDGSAVLKWEAKTMPFLI